MYKPAGAKLPRPLLQFDEEGAKFGQLRPQHVDSSQLRPDLGERRRRVSRERAEATFTPLDLVLNDARPGVCPFRQRPQLGLRGGLPVEDFSKPSD